MFSTTMYNYRQQSVKTVNMTWFTYVITLIMSMLLWTCGSGQINTEVRVHQGILQGVELSSPKGKPLLAFKGIPYAKPPIGILRFKAPQPPEEWSGTLQVTKEGSPCPQYDRKSASVIGDEDCLFLNIYTPKISAGKLSEKFPVVVLIHGGYFQYGSGSSDIYPPFTFTDNEIIMVSINYRLGALGFLSTNDEEIPGNFGLLDQVEVLRWIQRNIGFFGGDVNQVTLLGHGAGASSALFQLLSPLSRGLFNQIISISGTPLSDISLQKNSKKWAKELGTRLDCYLADSSTLLACLRKHEADEIVSSTREMHVFSHHPLIFLPVVERVFKENGDFLPDTPINLLKERKINHATLILGVSGVEGKLFYNDANQHYDHSKEDFFEEELPKILQTSTYFKHNHKSISLAIKQKYFNDTDSNNQVGIESKMIEMYADMLTRRFIITTAIHLSNAGWPTYMYVIDSNSKVDDQDNNNNNELEFSDELNYIFNHDGNTKQNDKSKIKSILGYTWMNFIKTSMPAPTKSPILPFAWIPMNPGKVRILNISSNPELLEEYRAHQMKFWNTEIPKIEVHGNKRDEL